MKRAEDIMLKGVMDGGNEEGQGMAVKGKDIVRAVKDNGE